MGGPDSRLSWAGGPWCDVLEGLGPHVVAFIRIPPFYRNLLRSQITRLPIHVMHFMDELPLRIASILFKIPDRDIHVDIL